MRVYPVETRTFQAGPKRRIKRKRHQWWASRRYHYDATLAKRRPGTNEPL